MNPNGQFPSLSQLKPKPKPASVYPIIYRMENGAELSAPPNLWIAAILTSLEPKVRTEVLNKVSNMVKQHKSGVVGAATGIIKG